MSCYHPLRRFIDSRGNGHITSNSIDFITDLYTGQKIVDYHYIGCGQCLGCRLQKSRDWANRCMLEAREHESNFFVTLTIDPEHIDLFRNYDPDTGEVGEPSVSLRQLQLFIKRLRKNTGQKIRYFACGEYGEKCGRPHYHIIFFGLKLDDLILHSRNFQGDPYYISDTIRSAWDYGYHYVANVTWDTCAYTARYVLKKPSGGYKKFYDDNLQSYEFATMSRKPGIARKFFDDHSGELMDDGYIYLAGVKNCRFRLPAYYNRLIDDVIDPDGAEERKASRRTFAEEQQKAIEEKTSKSYLEVLLDEEREFKKRAALILKRQNKEVNYETESQESKRQKDFFSHRYQNKKD